MPALLIAPSRRPNCSIDGGDHLGHRALLGDVGLDGTGVTADLRRHALGRLPGDVDDRHPGATGGRPMGARLADARAGSGDQDHLAVEVGAQRRLTRSRSSSGPNRARASDDREVPDHVGVRPRDEGLAVRHRLLELLGVEDRLEVVCRVEGHHREGVGALGAVDREDVVLAQAARSAG